MKVLIGAAAMAVLLSGAAFAQETTSNTLGPPPASFQVPASRCGEFPTAPTPPDGASASAAEMQAAMATFEAYNASYRQVLACRRSEAEEAQAIQQRRTQDFNGAVQSYNGVVTGWQAAAEAYNGRSRVRRRGS
ncbi:hypothetical protein U91I_02462 [alpha proteobacterium U9-1i]|nr:hypothetical protein U91I_02462 [alpha proteobacterium U9-1i]